MNRLITLGCAVALSLAAFSSCSNDPTLANGGTGGDTTGANINFQEVDRIGKPGIKELFLPYAEHDAYNRAVPQNDLTAYGPGLNTFVTSAAGRSAAISKYVQAILLPDALVASIGNNATTASYLGWETGGRIQDDCAGLAPNGFGGRGLNEDVVDTTLGLVYGNLATTAYAQTAVATPGITTAPAADDGKEQNGLNGTPNLTSDGVTCVNRPSLLSQFPYLANPI